MLEDINYFKTHKKTGRYKNEMAFYPYGYNAIYENQYVYYLSINSSSTLLFCERPTSVSLVAIGFVSP